MQYGRLFSISATFLLAFSVPQSAHSRPAILSDWESVYSSSQSATNAAGAGADCQLCHYQSNGGEPWNGYGWAIRAQIKAGAPTNAQAFLAVEDVDSDNDPGQSSNRSEIEENTQPGWTAGKNNHCLLYTSDAADE